jgi:two-component sensor histidine kinase
VKNVLATVQAIAAQSLAGPEVAEAARERFTSRLIALAQANELLFHKSWRGASLMAICMQIASPYGGVQSGRFVVDGAELLLKPGATMALALALHELATNAAKYGALSTPNGCVRLQWAEIKEGDVRRFELRWRESGGPAVTPPRRLGFGSRLIQRGLSGEIRGRVQMEYPPDGLLCVVNAPFEEVVAER